MKLRVRLHVAHQVAVLRRHRVEHRARRVGLEAGVQKGLVVGQAGQDQRGVGIEQAHADVLAFTAAFAVQQRRQHRVGGGHCRDAVDHRAADGVGFLVLALRPHEPGQALDDLVVGRPVRVRAIGAKAGDRHVNQARVDFAQHLVAEPQPVHHAGAEVFEDNIRRANQIANQFGAACRLELDANALLAAVRVHGRSAGAVPAGSKTCRQGRRKCVIRSLSSMASLPSSDLT